MAGRRRCSARRGRAARGRGTVRQQHAGQLTTGGLQVMMTRRQPHCRTCTWMVSFSTLTDVFLSVVFFQNSAESGSYVTMHGHHCARVRKAACERAGGERGSPPERSGLLQQVARQVRWSLRRIPSACPTPGRPRGSPQVARPCAPSRAAPAFGSSSARLRAQRLAGLRPALGCVSLPGQVPR